VPYPAGSGPRHRATFQTGGGSGRSLSTGLIRWVDEDNGSGSSDSAHLDIGAVRISASVLRSYMRDEGRLLGAGLQEQA